jgi:hypothetical protein
MIHLSTYYLYAHSLSFCIENRILDSLIVYDPCIISLLTILITNTSLTLTTKIWNDMVAIFVSIGTLGCLFRYVYLPLHFHIWVKYGKTVVIHRLTIFRISFTKVDIKKNSEDIRSNAPRSISGINNDKNSMLNHLWCANNIRIFKLFNWRICHCGI